MSDKTALIEELLDNPPKGAWKREEYDKLVIGATMRSPAAFFLIPFMAVWSGMSIGGIYGSQIVNKEFDLFLSLFGVPFLAGTVIMLSMTLLAIAGKVEVVIGHESYVFKGVGKIGIKKRFDWNSVIRIYESDHNIGNDVSVDSRYSSSRYSSIFIEGKERIKIGGGLKENRKYLLLTALKYYHSRK